MEASFPGGVAAIDSYDDNLPDGLPTWAEFIAELHSAATLLKVENERCISETKSLAERECCVRRMKS